MKAIFGMHKGEFGDVQFSELVENQLYRVSITCGDERWVNPKLSRWKGHLILWVRQKNDEGYFPRKGWGFNLLFQPENDDEKRMLYEYQWTYSPAPNVISYLITPLLKTRLNQILFGKKFVIISYTQTQFQIIKMILKVR